MKRCECPSSSSARLPLRALVVACVFAALSLHSNAAPNSQSPRERTSFNADWRFIKSDPSDVGDQLNYTNVAAWMTATGSELTTNAAAPKRPEGNLVADIA